MRLATKLLSDNNLQNSVATTPFAFVENLRKTFGNDLWAPECVGCKKLGRLFCAECVSRLKLVESFICPVCGRKSLKGFAHVGCRGRGHLDRLVSLYQFRPPLKNVIHRLKYRKEFRLAETIAPLMVEDISALGLDFGVDAFLVPVPMYFLRRWPRWYNQADLLAWELGGALGLKVRRDLLKRIFETKSQTKLTRPERKKNVEGVFWVPWWKKRELVGRDVLVVDDVCTTAATLNSCAKTLKSAGARYVWGLTVAQD